MSTNKTTNYQLHKWEPGDDFLRSEFNENFAKIDGALKEKVEIILGTYTGTESNGESSRRIELGVEPLALFVEHKDGSRNSQNVRYYYGGLAIPGMKLADHLLIDGTGFILYNPNVGGMNMTGNTYIYLAIVKQK